MAVELAILPDPVDAGPKRVPHRDATRIGGDSNVDTHHANGPPKRAVTAQTPELQGTNAKFVTTLPVSAISASLTAKLGALASSLYRPAVGTSLLNARVAAPAA